MRRKYYMHKNMFKNVDLCKEPNRIYDGQEHPYPLYVRKSPDNE
jgi:hypothetical protein